MTDGCTLLILAGGGSRRMGSDKAMLMAGQRTLVEHIALQLGGAVDEILVAAGQQAHPFGGLRLVLDDIPGLGPLSGMQAGLRVASQPLVWVVACDLPDVEPALGGLLRNLIDDADAAVPLVDNKPQGVCALYRVKPAASVIGDLLQGNRRRVKDLLDRIAVRRVSVQELRQVDPSLRSFRNLNTPADYEAWLKTR